MDRGAWWATVHGVTKSQTRLSDQAQHLRMKGLSNPAFWFYLLFSTLLHMRHGGVSVAVTYVCALVSSVFGKHNPFPGPDI